MAYTRMSTLLCLSTLPTACCPLPLPAPLLCSLQVQTLGGEGVLTGWQLVLRQLGYRPRRPPGVFPSNELVTSKYSLLTFLPFNLYDQFKRVANLYFLLLVCLQVGGGGRGRGVYGARMQEHRLKPLLGGGGRLGLRLQ